MISTELNYNVGVKNIWETMLTIKCRKTNLLPAALLA